MKTQRRAAAFAADLVQVGAFAVAFEAQVGDAGEHGAVVLLVNGGVGGKLDDLHVAAVFALELLRADVEDEIGTALLAGEVAGLGGGGFGDVRLGVGRGGGWLRFESVAHAHQPDLMMRPTNLSTPTSGSSS